MCDAKHSPLSSVTQTVLYSLDVGGAASACRAAQLHWTALLRPECSRRRAQRQCRNAIHRRFNPGSLTTYAQTCLTFPPHAHTTTNIALLYTHAIPIGPCWFLLVRVETAKQYAHLKALLGGTSAPCVDLLLHSMDAAPVHQPALSEAVNQVM